MTNNQTIIVFIVCTIYLFGLPFLLSEIGKDITLNYSTDSETLTQTSFGGNILTAIDGIPEWVSFLMVGLPLAIWVLSGILLFLHG